MSVEWNGDELRERVLRAVGIALLDTCSAIHAEAVRSIQSGGRSGREYRRRGVVHTASAPGEPPASDTGRLAQSGRVELADDRVSGTVTFATEYAAGLELGTQTVAPRPFMLPALTKHGGDLPKNVQRELDRELARD